MYKCSVQSASHLILPLNGECGLKTNTKFASYLYFVKLLNMITRIVKMSFFPEHVEEFKKLFDEYKSDIASSEGCLSLRLLQQKNTGVFFTYSEWIEESYLEQYRASDLFALVWSKTKILFNDRPEAWTNEQLFKHEVVI